MSRLPLVALALLAAAAVACSSGSAAGWTYAPPPSLTPAPSSSGSAGPSASAPASAPASASVAPSESASASASGGTGDKLTVTAPSGAATAGFDPKELEASANTAFTVVFDNQDTATGPHNWVLKDSTGAKIAIVGDTSFFSGPATREYQIPALAAGDYPFLCEVHPSVMTGTLKVK